MKRAELPPLANVLCCWAREPEALDAVERRLAAAGRTGAWRPGRHTLAVSMALPGAPSADAAGLVFAEGREQFADADLHRLADGAAPPGRFRGDFTVVRCSDDGLTAIRSCGGLVPLWTHHGEGIAIAATTLRWLLDALASRPAPDLLTCAMWASGEDALPDGRSFYEGIRLVPRGHSSRATGGRWAQPQAHWDERPADGRVERDPVGHARELRAQLLDHLDRNLPDDVPSLLTLSGGVDSTALAALAGRTLERPLVSFTILPPDAAIRAREERYTAIAAEHAGIRRVHRAIWTGDVSDRLWDRPRAAAVPILHPALLALPDIVEEDRPAVMFGGEFADDVCGHWWRLQDWIEAVGPVGLIRGARRLPLDRGDPLRWVRGRWTRLRGRARVNVQDGLMPMFREELQAEYREWVAAERARVVADRRPNRHLASQLRIRSDGPLVQNWEVVSLLGVRRSFPFHTRAMLELAGRTDVRDLLGPGTRRVLRRALADDVPAANLLRSDKGQWGRLDLGYDPEWRWELSSTVAAALRPPGVPAGPVDMDERLALQALLDIDRALRV